MRLAELQTLRCASTGSTAASSTNSLTVRSPTIRLRKDRGRISQGDLTTCRRELADTANITLTLAFMVMIRGISQTEMTPMPSCTDRYTWSSRTEPFSERLQYLELPMCPMQKGPFLQSLP